MKTVKIPASVQKVLNKKVKHVRFKASKKSESDNSRSYEENKKKLLIKANIMIDTLKDQIKELEEVIKKVKAGNKKGALLVVFNYINSMNSTVDNEGYIQLHDLLEKFSGMTLNDL